MRHEEYKELLALEAAGAVDPSERSALDAHLSSCAECRRELTELRDAAAALVYTVAPVEPPAALRAGVLSQIKELKARGAVAEAAPAAGPPVNLKEEARRLVRQLGLWDIFRARPALGFGAAAGLVLVAALGVLSLSLWGRAYELQAEVARLAERLSASEAELARGRGELARVQEVNDLLLAPGAGRADLSGTKSAPQAHALVAFDRASGRALLVAYDLPPAPAGKAYQLWFIADKKPLPGRVFKPDPQGRGRLDDRIPSGLQAPPVFAVTLEDERGVQTPAGAVYLLSAAS